ncbi:MAG: 3-phosphoserine/phosphohydroxythreonine transaminase [Propionibacteriaceae bacterium]|nr:3-phosphoserine/phosphohydroxythreonine transaminase [Propionibacteriaceae bacterium]
MRAYNFSAGPAMLPLEVLERAQSELTDWRSGMSVMEVSHRGKDFVACAAAAEASLREVLAVPDNYKVLFLQGGASGQFDAIPLNLTAPGDTVDFFNTGQWSKKAIAASTRQGLTTNVIADEAASRYTTVPAPGSYTPTPGATYLHYTPNETIGGVEFTDIPKTEALLVADGSSMLLSKPMDISQFGVVYGGAQKNMGIAGLVVVLVREDLLGRARPSTPEVFNWTAQAKADSMLNTPPTFSIYLLGLMLDWIKAAGGLTAMAGRNAAKAGALYAAIDGSEFYSNPVAVDARSRMNVPFILANPDLDKEFLVGAEAAGLTNLEGHRSVGGMRASLYNAMPQAGVQALIDYMTTFAAQKG